MPGLTGSGSPLVRYEKMDRSYLGLLMLAASAIVLGKINRTNQVNTNSREIKLKAAIYYLKPDL